MKNEEVSSSLTIVEANAEIEELKKEASIDLEKLRKYLSDEIVKLEEKYNCTVVVLTKKKGERFSLHALIKVS